MKPLGNVYAAGVMAISIALVSNTLQLIVSHYELKGASVYWIISLVGLGATMFAPLIPKHKSENATKLGSPKERLLLLIALFVAGIAASAYFIAIVGVESTGLGATIGETLDSSLAPFFYTCWACISRTAKWSRNNVAGLALISAGLFLITPSHIDNAIGPISLLLIVCGVIGAIGTSFSIWLLRTLVGKYNFDLGLLIAIRYGGVSIAWSLIGLFSGGMHGIQTIGYLPCLLTIVLGGVLINVAISASMVVPDGIVPAAVALIPILTMAVELLLAILGFVDTSISMKSPLLWSGMTTVMLGIWFLNRDPAIKVV